MIPLLHHIVNIRYVELLIESLIEIPGKKYKSDDIIVTHYLTWLKITFSKSFGNAISCVEWLIVNKLQGLIVGASMGKFSNSTSTDSGAHGSLESSHLPI